MRTRFDDCVYWVTRNGNKGRIVDMSTSHLMNTVRMLVNKPEMIVSMVVSDIETYDISGLKREYINEITSVGREEVVSWIKSTPLFLCMYNELLSRGVNVNNMLNEFVYQTNYTPFDMGSDT